MTIFFINPLATVRKITKVRPLIAILTTITFAQSAQPIRAQSAQLLSLESALSYLKNSPDWQTADLRYEASTRQLESGQAATALNVNAAGDLSYTNAQASGSTLARENSTGNASVTASINVLPWSQSALAVRGLNRALDRAALDRRDTRNALVINATSLYFTARNASIDAELTSRALKLSEKQLEITNAQRSNGQVPQEAVLNAQRALENAKLTAQQAIGSLEIARLTLSNALGIVLPDAVLNSTAVIASLPNDNLDALVKIALTKRSEIIKAQSNLTDSEDALSAAHLDRWLPGFIVSASYGQPSGSGAGGPLLRGSVDVKNGTTSLSASTPYLQSPTPSTTTPTQFGFNLSINIPLLAPSGDSKISTQKTALVNAKLALSNAQRLVELDVRQRLLDAQIASARLSVTQSAQASANQSLETAKAKRTAGTNTATDLESSEIALIQANRDKELATSTAMLADLRLENAIGNFEFLRPGGTK